MSALPGLLHGQLSALLESPALYRGNADAPAYEIKFLLAESQAREVERQLFPRMTLDPHADPELGNYYGVTSVYFDTPQFDVYRRSDGFRRRKFRIRRYGMAPNVFLEQKTKSAQRVRKRRTAIGDNELERLITAGDAWAGSWFAKRLAARALRPVCQVSYDRLALIGTSHDGPIRVTFDRRARGELVNSAVPDPVTNGNELLHEEVITEFKFLGALPIAFKSIIEGLRLTPMSVSKYRRCMEALGLVVAGSK